ncbi:zf-HC2 domain-containing protein [Micromonospora arborensis]|uniref:zf-HC2 domain-containing protein n=1 Tax=Micromonospora arborensis TaxID=2116518 RepID=UPI0034014A92
MPSSRSVAPMSDDSEDPHGPCADRAPYLLGALKPAEVYTFERHLAGCPGCQEACDDLGPAASALAGLPRDDVRELLNERVRDDSDRRDPPTGPSPPGSGLPPRGSGPRPPAGVGRSGPPGHDRPPARSFVPGRPPNSGSGGKLPHRCPLVRSWARMDRRRLRVAVVLGMLAALDLLSAVTRDSRVHPLAD